MQISPHRTKTVLKRRKINVFLLDNYDCSYKAFGFILNYIGMFNNVQIFPQAVLCELGCHFILYTPCGQVFPQAVLCELGCHFILYTPCGHIW